MRQDDQFVRALRRLCDDRFAEKLRTIAAGLEVQREALAARDRSGARRPGMLEMSAGRVAKLRG